VAENAVEEVSSNVDDKVMCPELRFPAAPLGDQRQRCVKRYFLNDRVQEASFTCRPISAN